MMSHLGVFVVVAIISLPGLRALECYTCESHEWRGENYGINPEPHSILSHFDCHASSLLRSRDPAPVARCPEYGNFVCVSAHLPYGRNTQLAVRGCYDPQTDAMHESKLCDANFAECCSEDRCNGDTSSGATRLPISETAMLLGFIMSILSMIML